MFKIFSDVNITIQCPLGRISLSSNESLARNSLAEVLYEKPIKRDFVSLFLTYTESTHYIAE